MRKSAGYAATMVAAWVACGLPGATPAASDPGLHYRYVSLNDTLPQEFIDLDGGFYPFKVTPRREVYGTSTACADTGCYFAILVWRSGQLRVLYRGPFIAHAANDLGVFAGGVFDFASFVSNRAALLVGGRLKRVDPLPDMHETYASRVTNTGIALIESFLNWGC